RNRGRPHVLADFIPGSGQGAARGREHERIIVAQHALDFQQLLLPELVEQGLQYWERKLQRVVQRGESRRAMQPQVPKDQVVYEGPRDSEILYPVWNG